jgi:quercetin dioxygenase-like cupin family protein
MFAFQLNELKLDHESIENDSSQRWRSQLPLLEYPEIESFSVVYFEVDPGEELALHTHDADEIIVLLNGSGECRVGDETVQLSTYGMVFVPANAPHGIRNTGDEMTRVFGVFPTRSTDAVFDHPVMPHGVRIFRTDEIPTAAR